MADVDLTQSDADGLPGPTTAPDTVPPGQNPAYIAATTATNPDGSVTTTYPHGDRVTVRDGASLESGGRATVDTITGNGTVVYQLADKAVAATTIAADGSSRSIVKAADGSVTAISRASGGALSLTVGGQQVANPAVGDVVLAAARSYAGAPYAWGAGGTYGPTKGEADNGQGANQFGDFNKVGFDCEGLVRYATYQATGHDIGPGTTNQVTSQYLTTVAPTGNLGVGNAQPGDLLYFENPPEHVAVYAGSQNGAPTIVQAPESGETVEEVPLNRNDLYGIRRPS
ncbi:cell wall-associated NlpC family hydrolase [Nocardia sp. GAS34]|uniref:C40 family peptidase n=1 Tax=unclassified Nocardia TaxID=2637762 RepID=UPI003D1E635B